MVIALELRFSHPIFLKMPSLPFPYHELHERTYGREKPHEPSRARSPNLAVKIHPAADLHHPTAVNPSFAAIASRSP
jgi:hypothetical protein